MKRHIARILVLLCGAGTLRAQEMPQGRHEIVTRTPYLGPVRQNAPIDGRFHVQNRGGSDGAGLCVISSVMANGAAQGLADFHLGWDSKLGRAAIAAPGGYSPEKLKSLVKRLYPELKWASIETAEIEIERKFSAAGYPVASTMSSGDNYATRIHHYVSIPHSTAEIASILDNNYPGRYSWVTGAERARRFLDGGIGWLWVWLVDHAPMWFWLLITFIGSGAMLCVAGGTWLWLLA